MLKLKLLMGNGAVIIKVPLPTHLPNRKACHPKKCQISADISTLAIYWSPTTS